MKQKIMVFLALTVMLLLPTRYRLLAATGDLGFFGGISEGVRLPKTTEQLLAQTASKKSNTVSMPYKEVIFLDGEPKVFEGLLEVKSSGGLTDGVNLGTYTVTHATKTSDTTDPTIIINRSITYTVNYRREGTQVIKDYSVKSWSETITLPSGRYVLDSKQSYSNLSILEDITPGVTYFKGSTSQRSVYKVDERNVTLEVIGSIYGYESAWSGSETHRLDCIVDAGTWQMQYQLRPSVSVNKSLQYTENEPRFISFPGNYMEVMQNKSGLQYDIFMKPQQFYNVANHGSVTLSVANNFELLTAQDLSILEGHAAYDDIKKLFAMQIYEGNPNEFVPGQATTRGQFVTALVKAIKLPITPVTTTTARSNKKTQTFLVFPDVTETRPEYPYIIAAYKADLASGRENGHFYIDSSISKQEAITIMVRALGLQTTAPNPTTMTPFVDDNKIASWAKREIYAAYRIGIIDMDDEGKLNPTAYLTKAECSALINRLLDFMRYDLQDEYTDRIVNYAS